MEFRLRSFWRGMGAARVGGETTLRFALSLALGRALTGNKMSQKSIRACINVPTREKLAT